MNRGIVIFLLCIITLGALGLYAIQKGPALFLKAPQEDRIAFVSDRSGRSEVWTMNSTGGDLIQVTNDNADQRSPVWSPDAMQIASICNKEGQVYQIYISAWNGRYNRRVTASAITKDLPLWSRGGGELTYLGSAKVYTLDVNTGKEEQYLPPASMQNYMQASWLNDPYAFAAWSPKHDYILCIQESDTGRSAFVAESDGKPVVDPSLFRPIPIGVAHALDAAWAPSGLRVAVAYIGMEETNGLQVRDYQSMAQKPLFESKGDGMGPQNPVWSPDGTKIAFEMWKVIDGSPDACKGIYVIDATGGKPRLLIAGDARQPTWSPDSSRIACAVSREDGMRDIWAVDASGENKVNLTGGRGDNYYPAWSSRPKGKGR